MSVSTSTKRVKTTTGSYFTTAELGASPISAAFSIGAGVSRATLSTTRANKFSNSKYFENVSNLMGLERSDAHATMRNFALMKPEMYDVMRRQARKAMLDSMAQSIYELYWDVLSNGKIGDSTILHVGLGMGGAPATASSAAVPTDLVPWESGMPEPEINKMAFAACDAVSQVTEELINTILPAEFNEIVSKAYGTKGRMDIVAEAAAGIGRA